jgi:hypothetical protein
LDDAGDWQQRVETRGMCFLITHIYGKTEYSIYGWDHPSGITPYIHRGEVGAHIP